MPKLVDKLFLRTLRETWTEVNTTGMSEADAAKFKKQKLAVDLYIDDTPNDIIVSRTGLTKARICQLAKKCATPVSTTGEIPGYNALIPGKILSPAQTKLELFFDEYPEIKNKIKGTYFGDKAYTSERRTNIRSLHSIFIEECRIAGVQDYEFPFTLKDYGYSRFCEYIAKMRDEEMMLAIKREGKDQRQQFLSTGYGKSLAINPKAPYDMVQIDGHIIDVLTVVTTEGIDGVEITDIATRMWLIAVIDVATRCIIGYSVSPQMNYNQYDVLKAIQSSIVPHDHKPFKLKSLSYPEGGGFPSEAIPETKWAAFNTIMLDNAKSHAAFNVVNKLTNTLGCVMNFGSVATPESRGIVERFFGTLERSGFHRLPNTTGSNPRDLKRQDAEKYAKEIKLTYEDVCEILESLIAEYNNSAHSALHGYTPLEMMATKIHDARMPIYTVPQDQRENVMNLTHFTIERNLRGCYAKGKQLRINFKNAVYHGLNCRIPMTMHDEKVLIEVNPDDLRTVKMYRKDGSYFCDLIAQGEYGKITHSLKTREMVNELCNELMTPDTIFTPKMSLVYEELAERGKTDRRKRTKAANMNRDANGAFDRPDKPAEIIDFPPAADDESSYFQPRRKAVGDASCRKDEPTPEEIAEAFAKYPNDSFAAIQSLSKPKKG
ncbi:MAG: hypothetical protein IKC24_06690 [Oscillospiraceae bacterium]|nr:hypothetical protein [Oscillospiraceae bacterium]